MLRGHIRNDYQIVAIDPEGEISEMTKLYGGNFIDLGKGGEFGMINPLEIILDADEEELKEGLGYTVLTKSLNFIYISCSRNLYDIWNRCLYIFCYNNTKYVSNIK